MMAKPALTPVTTPVALTVARAVLLLLHTPPVAVALFKVMTEPAQTAVGPVMLPVSANAFMLIGNLTVLLSDR